MPPSMPPRVSGKAAAAMPAPVGSVSARGTTSVTVTFGRSPLAWPAGGRCRRLTGCECLPDRLELGDERGLDGRVQL